MGKSEEATADATRRSVSRVATPSPTATAVAPCRRQKESTFAEAAREETRDAARRAFAFSLRFAFTVRSTASRFGEVDDVDAQDGARPIHRREFTPRSIRGIDPDHRRRRSHRRRRYQRANVRAEIDNRATTRRLAKRRARLAFHRRREQSLHAVRDSRLHLFELRAGNLRRK